MKIAVLGLGPSQSLFYPGRKQYNYEAVIGVNDIWSREETDYLVCVDRKDRFTPERLKVIEASRPAIFFGTEFWESQPEFNRVDFSPIWPEWKDVSLSNLPKSITSPFIASAIALLLGAEEVHVYGVDLVTHPALSNDEKFRRVVKDFQRLASEASMRGQRLAFTNQSPLSKFLPNF